MIYLFAPIEKNRSEMVFCGECKHFREEDIGNKCNHPDNKFFKYSYKEEIKVFKSPCELNRLNNCKWFEKKDEDTI